MSFSRALSTYRKNREKKYFRKRAGIELVIGHLKEDHRLSRNYYKEITGDEINVMLAAAGFNFKRMKNKWKSSFGFFLEKIFLFLNRQFYPIRDSMILQTRKKMGFLRLD
jgi:IS5 family transposase